MKEKVFKTELRFKDKKQRNAIKALAKKQGRSMNAQILIAIDVLLFHDLKKES